MAVLGGFKELLPVEHCGSLTAGHYQCYVTRGEQLQCRSKGEYIRQKGGMTAALHGGDRRLEKEVVQHSPQYLTCFFAPLSHHCHPGPDKGSVGY